MVSAACASAPSAGQPPARATVPPAVRTIGDRTLAARTARITISLAFTNPHQKTAVLSGTIAGPTNLTNGQASLTISLQGTIAQILGGSFPVTLSGGTAYVLPPPALAKVVALQPGKTYVSISVASLSQLLSLGPLGSIISGSPGELFDLFASRALKVTTVGGASVDGAPATHYRTATNVVTAVRDGGLSGAIYKLIKQQSPGLAIATSDVWVDAAGRMVKLVLNLPDLAPSPLGVWQAGATLALTIGFSQFGTPANVTVPPASAVQSMSGIP